MPEELTEDEWLQEIAAKCNCCPECWQVPCGGCMYGGLCDNMPCRCDEHECNDWEDLDPYDDAEQWWD